MEFVEYDEAMRVLARLGVVATLRDDGRLELELEENGEVVHLRIVPMAPGAADALDARASTTICVAKERMPDMIEHLIHKLGLTQVLLVPIGKWRCVFDSVAFRLAGHTHWQEIDATASMSLNTRDPLLCEPPDFHTLRDLIAALLADAETPEQGLMITSTAVPLMVEIHPDGSARASIGNPVLADEIIRTFGR